MLPVHICKTVDLLNINDAAFPNIHLEALFSTLLISHIYLRIILFSLLCRLVPLNMFIILLSMKICTHKKINYFLRFLPGAYIATSTYATLYIYTAYIDICPFPQEAYNLRSLSHIPAGQFLDRVQLTY